MALYAPSDEMGMQESTLASDGVNFSRGPRLEVDCFHGRGDRS